MTVRDLRVGAVSIERIEIYADVGRAGLTDLDVCSRVDEHSGHG
jgi:hypothetical protein